MQGKLLLLFLAVCILDEPEAGCQRRLPNARCMLLVAETPRKREYTREKDGGSKGDEACAERVDEVGLAEVDESVENRHNVVNAEY